MAAAAETIMEARIARLESDVGHLREDVADIKQDVRALRGKLDDMDQRLSGKIDALQNSFHSARIWALVLYMAMAGTMLATMARGFGWI